MTEVYIGRNVTATFLDHTVQIKHAHGPTIHIDTGSIDILWRHLDNIRIERARARFSNSDPQRGWVDRLRYLLQQ